MGFFDKIKAGLSKTRASVGSIFTGGKAIDDESFAQAMKELRGAQ